MTRNEAIRRHALAPHGFRETTFKTLKRLTAEALEAELAEREPELPLGDRE